jgi:hypothetical protein
LLLFRYFTLGGGQLEGTEWYYYRKMLANTAKCCQAITGLVTGFGDI